MFEVGDILKVIDNSGWHESGLSEKMPIGSYVKVIYVDVLTTKVQLLSGPDDGMFSRPEKWFEKVM